jgi:hypothetical protein
MSLGDIMLRKFSVENFKNFRDKITLDLTDKKNYEFNEDLIKNGVINKAIIYGKNASGKTNLGLAIFDITFVLNDFARETLPTRAYNDFINGNRFENFATFIYEFIFNNDVVIYKYKKKAINDLLYEELLINDKVIAKYDFVTRNRILDLDEAKTLNFESFDKNKASFSFIKYVANNTPLNKEHPIKKLQEFASSMLWLNSFKDNLDLCEKLNDEFLSSQILELELTSELERYLNEHGIECKLDFIQSSNRKILAFKFENNHLINFFKNASSGTIELVWLFYWDHASISFLFVDEFDAYYHYELAYSIAKKLMKNQNIQTIITTHNTYLLNNDLLRPDCYFIIENNQISNLPQRTSKDIREAHNLEKMFRNGEFE